MRYAVRNETATSPVPGPHTGPTAPDASNRRADTPTWLDGTMTVTGRNGSSLLAALISARNASAAALPYRAHLARIPTEAIVRRGYDSEVALGIGPTVANGGARQKNRQRRMRRVEQS